MNTDKDFMIQCFLIELAGRMKVSLRRYTSGSKCPGPNGYHNAHTWIGEQPEIRDHEGIFHGLSLDDYMDDARWPVKCEACDFVFGVDDEFQVFTESIWRRRDNGQEMILRDAPPGAIWNAFWLNDMNGHSGPDGLSLHCRLPGGHDWNIDGKCSNCDQPDRPHKCWVRHGTAPNLTVDKGAPGESCHAGAGSIVVPGWHGFLRNGILQLC